MTLAQVWAPFASPSALERIHGNVGDRDGSSRAHGDHAQESRVKTKGERDKEQQDESRRRRDNNGFHAV
jgi:hypothetical protein